MRIKLISMQTVKVYKLSAPTIKTEEYPIRWWLNVLLYLSNLLFVYIIRILINNAYLVTFSHKTQAFNHFMLICANNCKQNGFIELKSRYLLHEQAPRQIVYYSVK